MSRAFTISTPAATLTATTVSEVCAVIEALTAAGLGFTLRAPSGSPATLRRPATTTDQLDQLADY